MKALLLTAILCCTTVLPAATPRPNLTGTVLDANGNPLADVTVMVYHAGVKVGYSTYCPSCYIDCGKRTVTDAKGTFEIKDLAPDLWFTLLAARDGYVPEMTKSIDPIKSPTTTIKLAAKPPSTDFSGTVRGRVVEQDGTPVRDAVITPKGLSLSAKELSAFMPAGSPPITGEHTVYGTVPGLQPIAVTNKQGEFEIAYNNATSKMLLDIEARAMAPKFVVMETGPQRHSVTLAEGSTVTGRLIANGKPVPSVQIGLKPVHQAGYGDNFNIPGDPYQEIRIGTAADGRFTIANVPGPVDWYLYAKMDSISSMGATQPIEVKVTRNGEYLKTSDLVIKPGYRLRGTVLISDNKPIPEGMRITINSETIWDSQTVPLPSDGHFEFINLPPGKYTISTSVKGYREKTPQYGPTPFTVDRNIDNFTTTVYPNVP
jgi:Carboxypeptidase regulatory-like domain